MTAEDKLKQFLEAWSRKDYSKMYDHCQLSWKESHSKNDLKKIILSRIKSYEIGERMSFNDTIKDIIVVVKSEGKTRRLACRLLREKEPYKPAINGEWGVNPVSVIRGLYDK